VFECAARKPHFDNGGALLLLPPRFTAIHLITATPRFVRRLLPLLGVLQLRALDFVRQRVPLLPSAGEPTRRPTIDDRRGKWLSHSITVTRGNRLFDLRFHCFEVEARALLHRREVDSGLAELGHFLLHEHTAPELIHVPVDVS
jgi:hypothetical protein